MAFYSMHENEFSGNGEILFCRKVVCSMKTVEKGEKRNYVERDKMKQEK
jgi:NADH:ubiquinone oxidoreductase subunit E